MHVDHIIVTIDGDLTNVEDIVGSILGGIYNV
jgi:hypothetical protein